MAKNVIKAQAIPSESKRQQWTSTDKIIATFCYYYQQYTFSQARKLPYKRILMMLDVAKKIEAIRLGNMLQIVAAPHTKNFTGVKKLSRYFESISKQ